VTTHASAEWCVFSSPDELANRLASRVAGKLREAMKARGKASLALSGGRTPEAFLRELSRQSLPWEKLTVTLVDERFVPPHAVRSNEGLIREHLLQGPAACAAFFGLWSNAASVEQAAMAAAERLTALPLPMDMAILGMGTDGHTASFFPDAGNLDQLLDPTSQATVLPVYAPSAGEPRLTFSLARLAEARFVALHIEGSAKRDVLKRALAAGETPSLPVETIFRHAKSPVEIFWAPDEDEIR
jgi:6-phosphogluconolactonase